MSSADLIEVHGVVTDQHANGRFTVRLDSGHTVFAYLTGKIRRVRVHVVVGDRVRLQLSPYEPDRGRIVYREK